MKIIRMPRSAYEGLPLKSPKTKRDLVAQLSKLGCKILVNRVDMRIKDCTNWYWTGGDPILSVEKEGHIHQLICIGDVRIYGEKGSFVYKGGSTSEGELTPSLKKHGQWENNNWMEVNSDGSSYSGGDEVFFTLDDAIDELIARCNAPILKTIQKA